MADVTVTPERGSRERGDRQVDVTVPRADGSPHKVATVMKSTSIRTGQWEPATVNWSAWGAQCADEAALFAVALTKAVSIARLWDLDEDEEEDQS